MNAVRTYRWTRREYERLGETGVLPPDARVELIDGELIEMSPQGSRHFTAITLTEETLRRIFERGYIVRVQGPLDLGPLNQPEPDVTVVQGAPRDYADAHPTEAVLVVEVSDTTLAFDQTRKLAVYAGAGIPEYWIINLPEACVEVYREPKGDTYRSKQTFEATDRLVPAACPGEAVAVKDILP